MSDLIERLRDNELVHRYVLANELMTEAADRIEALEREVAAKQAEIDRLMLEYCPNEMTREQMAEWEKNQRPSAAGAGGLDADCIASVVARPGAADQGGLNKRDPFSTAALLISEWNDTPQDVDEWGNRAAEALGYLAQELHREIVAHAAASSQEKTNG